MPAPVPVGPPENTRQRDADRTRADILDVATAEFARRGFAGARVDEIAARTSTTKRMIYYYFGGKEQLYIAVLERAFEILHPETVLPDEGPLDALTMVRRIAERTFAQFQEHPDLIRLMIVENLYEARHLKDSAHFQVPRGSGFKLLQGALADGIDRGTIRPGIDAADIFMIINSYCAYRVANRFTFEQFTGRDLLDPSTEAHQCHVLTALLTSYLRLAPQPTP